MLHIAVSVIRRVCQNLRHTLRSSPQLIQEFVDAGAAPCVLKIVAARIVRVRRSARLH